MITTTSEFSSHWPSWPEATLPWEAPTTPPKAASAEPTTKAIANVSWMLMPSAETMARSSTPARITMPVRVRFSQTHSSRPIPIAIARITRRVVVYWTPETWRFVKVSKFRGQAMSSATPPKWASIWSARMIEIAIVISACRRSWPCVQRRKSCCMISPAPATIAVPASAGTIQCVRLTCELVRPNEPPPIMSRWIVSAT